MKNHCRPSVNAILRITGLIVLFATSAGGSHAANPESVDFDHLKTGFPLTGAHRSAGCDSCHVEGVFKGTPTQCALCHIPGNRGGATIQPPRHIPTNEPCEKCHTSTVNWSVVQFSHAGVIPGSCPICHNGVQATGKHPLHIPTTLPCDSCHRSNAWK